MKKFTLDEFSANRRDLLLSYKVYEHNFDEMIEGFNIVRESRSLSIEEDQSLNLYDFATQLEQRAWDSLVFLNNCYSGGHAISDLRKIYPTVLEYWESYTAEWIIFQKSNQSSSGNVAAIALLDTHFVFANQLICFAILLGWGNFLSRVLPIIDFNNPRRDGLLERLLRSYVENRGELPESCTRHLPYFKILKIFSAPAETRAELMKDYLNDWYHASRREPYYDSHKRGNQFKGYWAWGAAAVTYILQIDDSSFRDLKFYPADMVSFAKEINAPLEAQEAKNSELREKSGQVCVKSGIWETLDIPLQQRRFAAGEIMRAESASYGITVWRYIGD